MNFACLTESPPSNLLTCPFLVGGEVRFQGQGLHVFGGDLPGPPQLRAARSSSPSSQKARPSMTTLPSRAGATQGFFRAVSP